MPKIISNKSNVDLDYPVVRPSLDLDFTQEELDPRITFSRGSIGTRVNRNRLIETVAANQPRFDYDPVTGECKGLLIEESRVNSWLNSGQNNVTSWSFTPGCISFDNTQTAPDGTTNTIKFTERAALTSGMGFSQNVSVTSGTSYTFSLFVKQPENSPLRYCSLLLFNTGFGEFKIATFNPVSGAVLFTQGTLTTSVQKYSNGWWRFSVTGTATATTTSQFSVRFTNSLSSSANPPYGLGGPYGNYTGDGSSFLYFYGPQVENGAFMTSFIPTTTAVTRSADNASMTGTNFSSWYNQTEGTIYTNNRIPYTPNPNVSLFFTITNPSPFSRHSVEQTTANGLTYINQNGSGIQYWSTSGSGVFPANTNRKTTYSYSSSNNITILSGTSNQTYNFGQTSRTDVNKSMTGLYFGVFINSLYLNGTIARFTYYPKKLKDNQLLYLTQ